MQWLSSHLRIFLNRNQWWGIAVNAPVACIQCRQPHMDSNNFYQYADSFFGKCIWAAVTNNRYSLNFWSCIANWPHAALNDKLCMQNHFWKSVLAALRSPAAIFRSVLHASRIRRHIAHSMTFSGLLWTEIDGRASAGNNVPSEIFQNRMYTSQRQSTAHFQILRYFIAMKCHIIWNWVV